MNFFLLIIYLIIQPSYFYFTGTNKRIGVQLQDAHEQFAHIAKNHATAMQVILVLYDLRKSNYCTRNNEYYIVVITYYIYY